jgi:hypothetical protein
MAGGGGPHNQKPSAGLLTLGRGVGEWFLLIGMLRILDQQGVGNICNLTTYQL